MFFCCDAQRSAPKWIHRKRWNSQRLPNDDCGYASGRWQFSRVNCQGKSEMRASACWLPGHCGLLYCRLNEPIRPLAAASVAESDSSNRTFATRTGKDGARSERCRSGAVVPPPSVTGRQDEGVLRTMRPGWLVQAAFFRGLAGKLPSSPICLQLRLTSGSPFVLL
jgi:hypothetical protein